jgi:hypothetical protein
MENTNILPQKKLSIFVTDNFRLAQSVCLLNVFLLQAEFHIFGLPNCYIGGATKLKKSKPATVGLFKEYRLLSKY